MLCWCNVAAKNNNLEGEVSAWKSVNPDSYTMHRYSRYSSKRLNTQFQQYTVVCCACVNVELSICIPGPAFSCPTCSGLAFSVLHFWSLKLDIIGPAFSGPAFPAPPAMLASNYDNYFTANLPCLVHCIEHLQLELAELEHWMISVTRQMSCRTPRTDFGSWNQKPRWGHFHILIHVTVSVVLHVFISLAVEILLLTHFKYASLSSLVFLPLLSSSIAPSLFHFKLESRQFHKSFYTTADNCFLPTHWTDFTHSVFCSVVFAYVFVRQY